MDLYGPRAGLVDRVRVLGNESYPDYPMVWERDSLWADPDDGVERLVEARLDRVRTVYQAVEPGPEHLRAVWEAIAVDVADLLARRERDRQLRALRRLPPRHQSVVGLRTRDDYLQPKLDVYLPGVRFRGGVTRQLRAQEDLRFSMLPDAPERGSERRLGV